MRTRMKIYKIQTGAELSSLSAINAARGVELKKIREIRKAVPGLPIRLRYKIKFQPKIRKGSKDLEGIKLALRWGEGMGKGGSWRGGIEEGGSWGGEKRKCA